MESSSLFKKFSMDVNGEKVPIAVKFTDLTFKENLVTESLFRTANFGEG